MCGYWTGPTDRPLSTFRSKTQTSQPKDAKTERENTKSLGCDGTIDTI